MGGVNSYCIGRCIKLPETDPEVMNSHLANTPITCGQIITDTRIIHQFQNGHHHFYESNGGNASRVNQFDRSRSKSLTSQGTTGSNNLRRQKRPSRLRHLYNRIRRPSLVKAPVDSTFQNGGTHGNHHFDSESLIILNPSNGAAADFRDHAASSPPVPSVPYTMSDAGRPAETTASAAATSAAEPAPNHHDFGVRQVFTPSLAPHFEGGSTASLSADELRYRSQYGTAAAIDEGILTPSPSLASFVTCLSESARIQRPVALAPGRSPPPYLHRNSMNTSSLPRHSADNPAIRKIRVLEQLAAQCSASELELMAQFRKQLHADADAAAAPETLTTIESDDALLKHLYAHRHAVQSINYLYSILYVKTRNNSTALT